MFKPVNTKPNFPEMEKRILNWWYSQGLVEKYLEKNAHAQKKFRFLDGPITANNPMGVHHAWGRTYKDLWQRYFNLKGYKQRFQNGFDCQGLWVEVEVEKELGLKNKKDIENLVPGDKHASIAKFVNLCKERVKKYSSIQTEQSKRLGYFMDWDNSYYTNSDENNYMIWYFLKKCHEKGLLYKGHDSVPWCYRCGIAISQHEILTEDYQELTHETVYFKLPVIGKNNTYLLLWTTTPWTVPGNVAVAVNTKEKYVKVKNKDEYLILMKKRYEVLKKDLNLGEVLEELNAKDLISLEYVGPFDNTTLAQKAKKEKPQGFHVVISGVFQGEQLVTSDEGTGLLHVAPGAGEEDFWLGKEIGLAVINLIDEDANYVEGLEELSDKNAKIHPELIFEILRKRNQGKFFFTIRPILHRYPVCWRCKTELVWRVVDEWYIKMSEELRQQMRRVVKKIKWIPDFGLERELDWISNMHDWLISKKRYYGLCLPIYECNHCKSFEVIGSKDELKEKAIEGWDKFLGHSPHRPWVDEVKIKCTKCGHKLSRIPDVGNVWLDAGIVTFSTLVDPKTKKVSYMSDKNYFKEWYPADFITESFPGQFKNWFYSLLVMSTVLENHEPFKAVLGFATMVDEKGQPFHKSKGNAIEFVEGADKAGADVIRWFCANSNITLNSNFGFHVADEVRRRVILILWNIFNFYLTYASVNRKQKTGYGKRLTNILDKWIRLRLNQTIEVVTKSLDKYDAFAASMEIEKFVSDLSLWYVRRSRDRVAISNENTKDKNACLNTLYEVLITLAKLLAPFTPFLAEEIYQTLKVGQVGKVEQVDNFQVKNSVHLSEWPKTDNRKLASRVSFGKQITENKKLLSDMETVRKICELGHSKRKELRIKVRQPLNKFTIYNVQFTISDDLSELIKDELNVKKIELKKGKGEVAVEFDTVITPQLKAEGEARELVRKIQEARKEAGCGLAEKVKVRLSNWPKEYTEYIKKETLAEELVRGDKLEVLRSGKNESATQS